ncbi:hypothetical protein FACS1894110_09340 [Spirochaetia bacterium]|nr:hypothetical protein FACS1894110_09340 [Spirochaetia bacterium]
MKKCLMAAMLLVCFSFAAQAQRQQTYTVDEALTRVSLTAGSSMSPGSKIAVISYETPTKTFSDYVGETLTYDLQTKIHRDVITYRNVDTIHRDYKITGADISDTKAIEIGKALKVDVVLLVNVKGLGSAYQMNVLTINVASGKKGTPSRLNLKEDNVLTELLKGPAVTEQAPAGAPVEGAVRRLRAMREAAS